MINKKNVLGKEPEDIGQKDAIHTAIVSVRAGSPIRPGQRCKLNADREAVPDDKGIGVADPFVSGVIVRGMPFWLLLGQTEVPNVRHVWDNGTDFTAPTVEVKQNRTLLRYAESFGVTYQQLMDAVATKVQSDKPAPYPGTKTAEEVEAANEKVDRYDIYGEWADENLYEFPNEGTECCPEYEYPYGALFVVPEPAPTPPTV